MKKILLAGMLALGAGRLQAQLMTVKETSAKPVITLDLSKQPIVDINGSLAVQINRAQLVSSLATSTKANPMLTQKLNDLITLLSSEQQILSLLGPAIAGAAANSDSLKAYSRLMATFYAKLEKNAALRAQVEQLFEEAVSKFRAHTLDLTVYPTLQTYAIKNLDAMLKQTADAIASSKELSSYNIQVAGFISTKAISDQKVHIENFDNYTAGEYYEVPQWVTSFSQGDVNSFNQVKQLSATLNMAVSGNFSDLLKLIPDTLNSYACFTKLQTDIQTAETSTAAQASAQLSSFLRDVTAKLSPVNAALQVFQQQKNGAAQNPLQQFNQASVMLIILAKNLSPEIDTIKKQLPDAVLNANPTIKSLYTDLQNCIATLQADMKIISGVYNTVSGLLQPIQSSANAASQITGSVFDLNINQLPAMGFIELKTTGKRENGDMLVLKIITRTKNDIDKNLPGITLDKETIELRQISFYSESTYQLSRPVLLAAAMKLP